ncbi:MAG TPA: hypothetical protein VHK01_06255, partial [Lacipirellulaceae bacterium]|nr:hypothetical protein [Lacipirellulaceae bacterium]
VLPAFVVEGTGEAALRSMAAVLEANKEPKKDFPTGRELSLIFHTYFISLGLRLDPVEKTGNKYTIPYQMIGSEGYSVSVMYHYFAIIPLGDKLPPGEYEIVIEQLPTVDEFGGKIIHRSDLQWIVCSNGNFEVYINKDKK